jgi:plasmid stabilization system protein ParE
VTGRALRIHPAALEEAEAALAWYAERSQRAAEMFMDELDRGMEHIARIPRQYPAHEFGTRGWSFKVFRSWWFFVKQPPERISSP